MVMRIAFLGTGLMGGPMARRLAAAGHDVTAWNRDGAKARALADAGISAADTARDAVRGADHVILMLLNGAVCTETLFGDDGVAAVMTPGSAVIDMSSIPPDLAREHAGRLAALGIGHVDAPVSGGTRGAAEGSLAIMAGGDVALFDRLGPLFAPMGRATRVGPAGMGQIAKLANQAIVGVTIGAVAEAILLASVAGADPAALCAALAGGFADSRILREHGRRMTDRDFVAGGPVVNQVKDLDTLLATADGLGLDLPFSATAARLFADLRDAGDGALDHSALLVQLERLSGRR